MAQEVTNYGRFYKALGTLTCYGSREELKRMLVWQYTGGRTTSLREMTYQEYQALCLAMEKRDGSREELRRQRSAALKLMQQLGVDTTDWAQINDFCRHPRITGKEFGRLSIEELMGLATKLRSIKRKGWQRKQEQPQAESPRPHITYLINLAGYPGSTLN